MVSGICLLTLCLGADIYADLFAAGNAAYARGDMEAAVASYEQLIDAGVVRSEVFYNLGSAYFHLDNHGYAVLNFERAVAVDDTFDAAHRALAVAVSESGGMEARPEGFKFAGRRDSWLGFPREPARASGVAIWWLVWGILTVRQWRSRGRWKKAAAVAWGILAVCAVIFLWPEPRTKAAVVVQPQAPARFGPNPQDVVRMALTAGERVVVDRVVETWARVELADGRRGWVDQEALAFLGPPFDTASDEREKVHE